MITYADVNDIIAIGRSLTPAEQQAADKLIEIASAKLRILGTKYGRDIDKMIADNSDYTYAAKDVVVKSVVRALDSMADNAPAAIQSSQAALGYSVSMTYLNAGQSIYFLKNELRDLGIMRQRYGAMEVYNNASND